ncbi:Lrp/AsnC family transcriptional regulator [Candidatus Micrarchaeota archaeon]|nr:Lrp/AsnC family transcriptional regulator [Candidatus Micrarchaeota archaeon]
MKSDELDKKILGLLKNNSRMSNVEIAKTIGLTEGAVRHRIDSLLKQGVIKRFTLDLSSEEELFAIVMVKSKTDSKKMMKDVSSLKLANDAYEISGEFDGCVILSGSSMEVIDKKIDQIRSCNSVADTKTFISLHHW